MYILDPVYIQNNLKRMHRMLFFFLPAVQVCSVAISQKEQLREVNKDKLTMRCSLCKHLTTARHKVYTGCSSVLLVSIQPVKTDKKRAVWTCACYNYYVNAITLYI